jgi:methionyl-tRNA formyltransferase
VRLVFLGTPADATPALQALHREGHEIALVVTQPDKRRGRGSATQPSPVRRAAEELGLRVITPAKGRDAIDDVRATGAELGVVVAFGQLLPPAMLEALPLGFVNVHFSLLPRWRGAAPVERAMLAGDAETGVCIMELEEGLDTGPVYACESTPIGDHETAGELHTRLVEIGTRLLVETVPQVGHRQPTPQDGEPTYAEKLTVDEFRLDPGESATRLARVVRAGNPRPGAWMVIDGHRAKVLRANAHSGTAERGVITRAGELGTADGVLVLEQVQPEGKRPMRASDWLNGLRTDRLVVEEP